jgi:hypothetical protein
MLSSYLTNSEKLGIPGFYLKLFSYLDDPNLKLRRFEPPHQFPFSTIMDLPNKPRVCWLLSSKDK